MRREAGEIHVAFLRQVSGATGRERRRRDCFCDPVLTPHVTHTAIYQHTISTHKQATHLRLLVDGLPEGRELSVRLATAIGESD